MKRPTVASLKKVTAENLAALGADRLAEILVSVAESRPDVKRRLRMELAAEQGAEHLSTEIDKRLATLEASRGKISWRLRPNFIRDLDTLRGLISDRLAELDRPGALSRLWAFLSASRRVNARMRDRDGELNRVFARAAADIGGLISDQHPDEAASTLVDALAQNPAAWAAWLPGLLDQAPAELAKTALHEISHRPGATLTWLPLIRLLADVAGDVDAFRASFTDEALTTPSVAAEVAQRLMAAERLDEAGAILERAADKLRKRHVASDTFDPDYAWETAWIDYLDRAGQAPAAQTARWASFERTVAVERAKAFTSRLDDFDDVEAEHRAFAYAATHPDFRAGLSFLMEWPALVEAAQMIRDRAADIEFSDEQVELWAAKLRIRQPAAAHQLLRKAAEAAFRRRDFKTSQRLTDEADTIPL
ncbi:hypothetical protein LJR219_003759 [Phenylobacterium sp. LjRoot219]|uniref:DUF6880 family protein n=1 Tax=Phenylobacterium sp. LjRoot219 TaxID=3342283 RepID=UPI003ECF4B86